MFNRITNWLMKLQSNPTVVSAERHAATTFISALVVSYAAAGGNITLAAIVAAGSAALRVAYAIIAAKYLQS